MLLNSTFSAAANVSTYLTREPDPAADKRIASMRDGSAFSYGGNIYFYAGQQLFNAADDNAFYVCTPTSANIVWNTAKLDGVSRAVTKGASVDVASENKGFYFGGQSIVPKGADDAQADRVLNDTFLNNLVVLGFSESGQETRNITAPTNRAKPLAQSNLLFVPAGKEGILVNLGGDDGSGDSDKGTIIGGVVGGVAGVILIGIVAVYFIMKNNRKKSSRDVQEAVAEVKRNSAATQPFLAQPLHGYPSAGYPSGDYAQGYTQGYPEGYSQGNPYQEQQQQYKDDYAVEAPANERPAELAPVTPVSRPSELPS
ncbi:hypothetical protein ABW20_dc0108708 [Dactylellina cionopaga]|nr:hypothetical protein ABW20_dc0108708 [Dactylellina cionopaga]